MIYRAVAINGDRTLFVDKAKVTSKTREAIRTIKRKGIYVTLVTNYSFLAAKRMAKQLQLDEQFISFGGAFIGADLTKMTQMTKLSELEVRHIVEWMEHFDCHIRLLHETFSLGNRKRVKQDVVEQSLLLSTDPLFYPVRFVETLSSHLANEPVAVPQIELYFASVAMREEALRLLATMMPNVTMKLEGERKVVLLASGVSKEDSLRRLWQSLDIDLAETIAIGGEIQDIAMIEAAGLGVATLNSPLELRQRADWITRSSTDDGVAYVVQEVIRKQQPLSFKRRVKYE